VIFLADKIPIGLSFQRLSDAPLDSTSVFETYNEALAYAEDFYGTSYTYQLIYVKDARTDEEKSNGVEIYSKLFYVDSRYGLREPCIFKKETLDLLFELLDNMVYKTDISGYIEQFKNSFK
jgi:hypothetical protein